ncbi:hypothetical protein ACRQ5D_17430 [Mucilaginibacter sp. P25]|uniref:hypothetical protein n=1 Tax=unclassified Mucilaginibacter TaxID=2617802 RepID=UPI003D67BE20
MARLAAALKSAFTFSMPALSKAMGGSSFSKKKWYLPKHFASRLADRQGPVYRRSMVPGDLPYALHGPAVCPEQRPEPL